jgi:hypothetical protein
MSHFQRQSAKKLGVATPAPTSIWRRIREFFLLEDRRRRRTSITPVLFERMTRFYTSGTRRLQATQNLRGSELTRAALRLYQEGNVLMALAFLVSNGREVDSTKLVPEDVLRELDTELCKAGVVAPKDFLDARPMLLSGDLLAFDRLPAAELDRQVAIIENATEWTASLVDPVSMQMLKATSVLRLLSAVLVVVLPLAWVGAKIFAPKNYALRKPATSSSTAYGTSPDGAVDGAQGAYGFHSGMEDMPWWAVDLTHPMTVTRIVVYGRGDCCYDQSIPLDLEVSDDGTTYRKIAERTDEFSASNPWVVKPDSLVTRLIRLRAQRHAVLVLNEVEVNGRSPK